MMCRKKREKNCQAYELTQVPKSVNCYANPSLDNIRAYKGEGRSGVNGAFQGVQSKKFVFFGISPKYSSQTLCITTSQWITTPTLSAAQPAQTSSFPSYPTPRRIPVKFHTHYTTQTSKNSPNSAAMSYIKTHASKGQLKQHGTLQNSF